ncbi:MAG: formate/nitrite transporter family protein, partial [Burkholderiaceae bacterium]
MSETQEHEEAPAVTLTQEEEANVKEQVPHRSPVVFEIIRRSGEEELNRPLASLWWSGLCAGLSIGFSVLSQALLRKYLPDASWTPLIEKLGYTIGFAIVILARQQLFTENTITAVVPLMAHPHLKNLLLVMRLWLAVLIANVVGATFFSLFLTYGGALDADLLKFIHDISVHATVAPPGALIGRGVVAGFLIATLVWIMAGIEGSKLSVIVLFTYLIALGNFGHVVAGSVEASFLVIDGTQSIGQAIFGFFFPALIGNMLGGTAIFTLLAYGQIRNELKDQQLGRPEDRGDGGTGPNANKTDRPARPTSRGGAKDSVA